MIVNTGMMSIGRRDMRIIRVKTCNNCPYLEVPKDPAYRYCSIPCPSSTLSFNVIKDIFTIPDWCPLEKKEERADTH